MKNFCNCLGGALVFLCLLGSCSMGEVESDYFSTTEETSQKEKETVSDDETLNEEENPDDTQDDPEEIPPAAEFLSCKVVSETEIVLEFTLPVKITSLEFTHNLVAEEIEDGSNVKIKLVENPEPGLLVTADFQAEDEHKNSISKQISFRTKNNRVPHLQINELRTENASATSTSGPKAEFIEFKMLSDGNLGALSVYAESNYKKNPLIYVFEPVEVKKGEYVVLHLRTLDTSCKNEYGKDLDESGGTDSSPTARDFWIPGSTELLRKTDAVYIQDQNGTVLDAVMFLAESIPLWDKTDFEKTADDLFNQGFWISPAGAVCDPADAVNSSKTTATQTICRDETAENTHTKADWYITKTSGATPGRENNPGRL